MERNCMQVYHKFIVYLYLIIAIKCCLVNANSIKPMIEPNDADLTILPGENVSLMCRSTVPIHWHFQQKLDKTLQYHESRTLGNTPHQNLESLYESRLELHHVNCTNVGYYYCLEDSRTASDANLQTLVESSQVSKIYLFVDDTECRLVPSEYPIVEGNLNEEVVIPCKPTSKKWEVELIKENDKRHEFDFTFNPTEGYRITLNELTDGGVYTCITKDDIDLENAMDFAVYVNSVGNSKFSKPIMTSKSENYGIEGDQLEINCTIEADLGANFQIKWMLPNNDHSLKDGRARIIEPIAQNHPNDENLYYTVSQLIVRNADKAKDVGVYKCLVEDDSMNHNAAELNIVDILGDQESFIDITEPNGKYNLRVTPKIREVKWVVDVRGHPTPTLVWRDREGDEIPWSTVSHKGCKYEATQNAHSVTLKIKDIRYTDTGDYTLYADNGRVQKKQKFHLDVLNIVRTKPRPTSSIAKPTGQQCTNCTELHARIRAAEQQIKLLNQQLQEAKALNVRTQNEQLKYRDLYLNNCHQDRDNRV